MLVVACDPKELAPLLGPILASPHVEAAESISGLLPSLSAEQRRSLASLLAGFAATPNPPQPPAPQDWPEWAAACEDLAAFRERALYWVEQLASPV